MKIIRTAKQGYILSSLAFCASGIFLLVYPEISALTLCYLAGALLLVCGIAKLLGYWSKDPYRLAFQFDLALGLLSLVIGLVMILHPSGVIRLIYFVIGIVALIDGLFKIQTALDARRFGIAKWWLIGVIAIITNVFGLLLILKPFESALWMLSMVGFTMLLEGILNLCVGLCTVKVMERDTMQEFQNIESWRRML